MPDELWVRLIDQYPWFLPVSLAGVALLIIVKYYDQFARILTDIGRAFNKSKKAVQAILRSVRQTRCKHYTRIGNSVSKEDATSFVMTNLVYDSKTTSHRCTRCDKVFNPGSYGFEFAIIVAQIKDKEGWDNMEFIPAVGTSVADAVLTRGKREALPASATISSDRPQIRAHASLSKRPSPIERFIIRIKYLVLRFLK